MLRCAAIVADHTVPLIAWCWTCGLIGRWTDGLISWLFGLTSVIDYPLVTDCRDSLILFAGSSIGTQRGGPP